MTHEEEIEQLVIEFVGRLREVVRKQALQRVMHAVEANGEDVPQAARSVARESMPPTPQVVADTSPRRSPGEIEADARRLLTYIAANPGMRAEQIAEAIGESTERLALPIRKLLKEHKIKKKGTRRATRYWLTGVLKPREE